MPRKESADKPQADILTVPLLQTQMTPLYDLTGTNKTRCYNLLLVLKQMTGACPLYKMFNNDFAHKVSKAEGKNKVKACFSPLRYNKERYADRPPYKAGISQS